LYDRFKELSEVKVVRVIAKYLISAVFTLPMVWSSSEDRLSTHILPSIQVSQEVVSSKALTLPIDVWKNIFGSMYLPPLKTSPTYENWYLGFLSIKDLANLARCKTFRPLVQPLIDYANAWRKSQVVFRVLRSTLTNVDRAMASLLLGRQAPYDAFTLAVYTYSDSRFILPHDEHGNLTGDNVAQIINEMPLLNDQSHVLHFLMINFYPIFLFPQLPLHYQTYFPALDNCTGDIAKFAWMKVAKRINTNYWDYILAAMRLEAFGEKEVAINAFLKALTFTQIDLDASITCAEGFARLGQRATVLELCHRILNSPQLKVYGLQRITEVSELLGKKEAAIEALKRAVVYPEVSTSDLSSIATAFVRLRETSLATEVCNIIMTRPNDFASDNEALNLSREAYCLCTTAFLLEKLNLKLIGISVWKKVVSHPMAKNWERLVAVDALECYGEKDAAIEACDILSHRPDVSEFYEDISRILENLGEVEKALTVCYEILMDNTSSVEEINRTIQRLNRLEANNPGINFNTETRLQKRQSFVEWVLHVSDNNKDYYDSNIQLEKMPEW
jgi:tetratricopeptide (TPR) repeat protein